MLAWLRRILQTSAHKSTPGDETPEGEERRLALEREIQELKLDRQERERTLTQVRAELEQQRGGESARVAEEVQAALERMAAEAAAPVSQLAVQAALLDEGKPVQARDVMQVARRLSQVLENHGLALAQAPGDAALFDPDQHEPLSAGASVQPGDAVVVRLPGVTFQGRMLRKAGVERSRQ